MKKYIPEIRLVKYKDQFQIGIIFNFTTKDEDAEEFGWNTNNHFHIWIDLGFYCIEITIGERE